MQHILVASALECDFHIDYVLIFKSNSTPDWETEFHLFSLSGYKCVSPLTTTSNTLVVLPHKPGSI